MSDRDALYRAILANPADDTPRLAYADWLEENGRPEEAEFIHIGCRLESITPNDVDFTACFKRNFELQQWLSTHVLGPKLKFPAGLQIRGGNWWGWSLRGFPQFLHYNGLGRSGLKPMRMLGAGAREGVRQDSDPLAGCPERNSSATRRTARTTRDCRLERAHDRSRRA